jgi:uncharacterized protein with ParB-like and HNH nuclease domain
MEAHAVPLLAIFEKKLRLEVPLFQRQYVWNEEQQWEPLWEDIERKFTDYIEGRKDSPVHFLGAIVLDQKQTPTTHVEKRQIIDGQQRLTTLQIFLSAFRDFCREQECEELAEECEGFTLNRGMMASPEVDRFKVWPTNLDRAQFTDVIDSGSHKELERRHPLVRRKYARKPEPRPRMVEAYLFFRQRIENFFLGSNGELLLASEAALSERLEECFHALKNALQVATIDLETGDDAQVIFETLNARGEPLLPADLLRNYIFLRAARNDEPVEALYEKHWKQFDDAFWRKEVKQGRLLRPRSDLFIQHFLASRQTYDIPIKHLFVEYKHWIERAQPFKTVAEELATLARQGGDFRKIIQPNKDDPIYALAAFLDAFDVRTSYPLLLALFDADIDEEQWRKISVTLESYLLRRAVCGLTTKNYNRIFLSLTRSLRREGITPENLESHLTAQSGESVEWPTDEDFTEAWRTTHAYRTLNNAKIVHILKRLNNTYYGSKMEPVSVEGSLTVEHIMPQNWIEHWPLEDGSQGMNFLELIIAEEGDPRAGKTRAREAALQTFGNLTILTQSLNAAISNGPWAQKKPELLSHSLLPINQQLFDQEIWNEATIAKRSNELLERALKLWPKP